MSAFASNRLIPLNFVTEIAYPPQNLPHPILLELFNELSGPHGFLNLNLLPENKGAVFSAEKGNRFEILTDKLVLREETNVVSFDSYCDQAIGIVGKVFQKLLPPVLIGQMNIVRMLYPLSSEQAANQFLMQSFLSVPEGIGQRLGRPLAGIGMRLVFPPTQQMHNEYQIRIEPFFRDQTQIFLENAGRFFPPFKQVEEIRSRLDATYNFLKASLEALFAEE
jgi:hypothetical protein